MQSRFELRILNFRSHAQSHLQFDGRPLVIIGRNGAGKTNLLEAISMLSAGRGFRRAERDALAKQPENIGWKLEFTGGDFRLETSARTGEPRKVLINDKSAPQSALGNYLRQVWMMPSQDRIWIDSASERRRFFDRIVLSFAPDHGEAVLAYEKAMRERNRLLKDGVSDPHWYQAIEANMEAAAIVIVKNRKDAIARLNAEMLETASLFPIGYLSLEYEEEPEIASSWGEFWESSRTQDRFSGTTRFGPHKVNFDAEFVAKSQRAALCSTGEQKALLISLFLANARALIKEGKLAFLLLDEAVAHLDENRRAALFDELCALEAQVVMTGTELALFEALGDRAKIVEVFEGKTSSEIQEQSQ